VSTIKSKKTEQFERLYTATEKVISANGFVPSSAKNMTATGRRLKTEYRTSDSETEATSTTFN